MTSRDINLVRDGIQEAVCEIRFDSAHAGELALGRLADAVPWRGWTQVRLPAADLPAQLRSMDQNLRFQPSFELKPTADATGSVRIGQNAISWHQLAPYRGWTEFQPSVRQAVEVLFSSLSGVRIVRAGLRYINTLNVDQHHVTSPHNLDLQISAGGESIREAFTLIYRRHFDQTHVTQVTVATPEYVQAPKTGAFSVLVDVDVFSPDSIYLPDSSAVAAWIENAHDYLKDRFFSLLPEDVIEKLRKS
jgi:uncharacterized protein (TIGR04255 family)